MMRMEKNRKTEKLLTTKKILTMMMMSLKKLMESSLLELDQMVHLSKETTPM